MDTHEESPLGDLDTDERTGTDDDHPGTDDDHTHDPRPIAVPTKQLGKLGEFLINMVSVEPSLFKRKKEGEEDTNIYLQLDGLFVLHGDYATIVTAPNTTLNMERSIRFEAIMANAFVAGLGDFEQFKQVKCG